MGMQVETSRLVSALKLHLNAVKEEPRVLGQPHDCSCLRRRSSAATQTDHTNAPARWHDEAAEAAKPHDLALIPIERHTIRVDMTAIKSTAQY